MDDYSLWVKMGTFYHRHSLERLFYFSDCVAALYVARFIAGVACGGVSVAAPMYIAELAHTSIRGTLGTFFQVLITVGVLLEYLLGE